MAFLCPHLEVGTKHPPCYCQASPEPTSPPSPTDQLLALGTCPGCWAHHRGSGNLLRAHLDRGWQRHVFNPHQAENQGDDGECHQRCDDATGEGLLLSQHRGEGSWKPKHGRKAAHLGTAVSVRAARRSAPKADTVSSCATQKPRWTIRSPPGKSNIRIKYRQLEERGAGCPAGWQSHDGTTAIAQVPHPLPGGVGSGRGKRNLQEGETAKARREALQQGRGAVFPRL